MRFNEYLIFIQVLVNPNLIGLTEKTGKSGSSIYEIREKPGKNRGKTGEKPGKNRGKTREKLGKNSVILGI